VNISHSPAETLLFSDYNIFASHQTAKMASSNNEQDLLPDQTEGQGWREEDDG